MAMGEDYERGKSIWLTVTPCSVQELGPAWQGGQFCIVNLELDAAPYMRLLFLLLFLAPVLACLGLMVRVWCRLQSLRTRLTGLGMSERSLQQDRAEEITGNSGLQTSTR